MNPKDDDFICFYRDAVIAGHDDPAAETMRRFNLSRDYTVRLLNEAIAGCEGQDIRNWARRMRSPGRLTNALTRHRSTLHTVEQSAIPRQSISLVLRGTRP
jgi:hypothetical protein